MKRPTPWEREASKVTSEIARRAIRRLDVLEWVILAATAMLAVGGGLLVAMLLVGRSAPGFRGTWIATSLLLLIVPGVFTLISHRRDERRKSTNASGSGRDEDG